jgi:hypothetical protein
MERTVKIIVAVLVVGVLAFFIYSKIANWHRAKVENAVKKEQEIWQQKASQLEQEITNLQEELTVIKGQQVPEEKIAAVLGEENTEKKEIAGEKKPPGFGDIERQIRAFFSYLDDQEYVQSLKLEGGIYQQYLISVEKLSSNLPIVTGEMDSLYNMVRNVAHLYRALGKQPVLLTKQVLQNESEVMESVMKTFYLWFTMDDGGKPTLQGRPSGETLYEYAGFFLNTLGGRSYLLRRGPKERTLTTYYSVLILDRANDAGLNAKGIDIRPYIASSLKEIQSQMGLIYQKEYIAKLRELNLKYPQGQNI